MSNEHQEDQETQESQVSQESQIKPPFGATASASTTATGGVGGNGGAGGAGGAGGQAINITYVDNYSIFMLLYTLILMLIDDKNSDRQSVTANQILPLLNSIMEEQKEYREAFLETLQSLRL